MKIALVRKEYNELHGGAERYAVNLARGLADIGHDVHFFCGMWPKKESANIRFHRVPYIKSPSPLKNLTFQRNVRRLIAKDEFDIVNGLAQIFPQDVYRVGDPLHIHWIRIHTPNPGRRILKYLSPRHRVILSIERQIFRAGNYRRIITNSLLSKNQLVYYYGVPQEKVRIVYNGVNLQQFNSGLRQKLRQSVRNKIGLTASEPVLLFVGHDFKRKGLQFAIQSVIGLKDQGHRIKLVVAGRGNRAPFLRIIKLNGLLDDILFLGQTSNIEELYCASDILIHPALYDPFSNVCLEAMACGLPVMTTRLNGASEIIEDGCTGLIVDAPGEVEKMIAGISGLLENGGAGIRLMGESAARAVQECSVEKNIKETLAVYKEILHEKGGSGSVKRAE
jgi:UDP-glucose:(heptosyl)LPS alpha-1,3-glucosyltransferase